MGLDALLRRAATDRSVINFAGGLPAPETFPREALARAAHDAMLNMGEEPMQYGWPEGQAALRRNLLQRLARRGLQVDPEDLHICNGAQDAIGLVLRLLQPRAVQVDALTYPGALELIRGHGATPSTEPCALRYAMPGISNPRGLRSNDAERDACLACEWVIEDDAYAELDFEQVATPMVARAPERVFHVGTLSKTVAPGLRIGWLVAPERFREPLRTLKSRQDLQSNGVTQAIAARLLADEVAFEARLAELRGFYRARAERLTTLLEGLDRVRFVRPHGGFSIWLETDGGGPDEPFLQRSIERFGVSFDPGGLFRATKTEGPRALRVSYSALPEHLFAEGVERLSRALTG